MRVSGFWSLMGAVVTALIIADLWHNPSVTNQLIQSGTTISGQISGGA